MAALPRANQHRTLSDMEPGRHELANGQRGPLKDRIKVIIRPQVDLKDPKQSALLRKGTNAKAHGGGKQFSEEDAAYRAILAWIEAGAPEN